MSAAVLIALIVVVPVAVILNWAPISRRHGAWFGISVTPDFAESAQARRFLFGYRVVVWALTLIALAASFDAALMAGAVLLQTFGAMAAFLYTRRLVRPYAAGPMTVRSASLLTSPEGLPGGWSAALAPFGILAATALYLRANWVGIPARFPVHWGFSGEPDRWAARDWHGVYGVLIIAALLTVALLVTGEAILRGSPRGPSVETAAWTARFRRANLRLLMVTIWAMAGLFGFLSLSPLLVRNGELSMTRVLAPVAAFLALILLFVWPVIRICQEPGSPSDGTPDDCWKLGQIYYNPSDPAIIVAKRFGFGYTLNFGNRVSWALAGVFLIPVVLAFWLV